MNRGASRANVDVVLALGFDLFFRPRLNDAAATAGVTLRHGNAANVERDAVGATRVVADVSAPGIGEALVVLRKHHPHLPILACYPHVEVARAEAVRALGGIAIPRGSFNANMPDALRGTLR